MTKAKPVSALSSPSWILISLFLFLFQISTVTFAKKGGEPADQPPSEQQPDSSITCSVTQPSQVTALTLLPSDSVTPGTDVTVKIDGYGCCFVSIETNGASDVDGGFGDYALEYGPFPKSQTFTANTEGNFKIAIIAINAADKSCLEDEAFAINTTLHVGYKKPQMPEMKPKKKIPLIPNTQPKLTPRVE